MLKICQKGWVIVHDESNQPCAGTRVVWLPDYLRRLLLYHGVGLTCSVNPLAISIHPDIASEVQQTKWLTAAFASVHSLELNVERQNRTNHWVGPWSRA